jgi:signal transduction histidine kinase
MAKRRTKPKAVSDQLRRIIENAKPGILELFGLQQAIESQLEKSVNSAGRPVETALEDATNGILDHGSDTIRTAVFRIVQEALTNIKKHANAYIVRVLLSHDSDGNIRILIENDGNGFDQEKIHSSEGDHLGLTIMKERAKHLGGSLKIESEPDEGTRVELRFRYQDTESDS